MIDEFCDPEQRFLDLFAGLTSEFGLGNFVQLFARAPGPLANTLILAAAAAVGAALIGVPIGYVLTRARTRLAGLLDIVAMVPFAVAGTVLGIGLVIAFNAGFLVLTGGWLILVIAYIVRKLPFNVRASSAILHQIDPSLEEASINLGVSPAKIAKPSSMTPPPAARPLY